MRKTRLVILPTKCLHQMGFLLLFLACPVIGNWGRIRPESETSHKAVQIEKEGTCGLQRETAGGILDIFKENRSNQCRFENYNIDDVIFGLQAPKSNNIRNDRRSVDGRADSQQNINKNQRTDTRDVRLSRDSERRIQSRREREHRRVDRKVREIERDVSRSPNHRNNRNMRQRNKRFELHRLQSRSLNRDTRSRSESRMLSLNRLNNMARKRKEVRRRSSVERSKQRNDLNRREDENERTTIRQRLSLARQMNERREDRKMEQRKRLNRDFQRREVEPKERLKMPTELRRDSQREDIRRENNERSVRNRRTESNSRNDRRTNLEARKTVKEEISRRVSLNHRKNNIARRVVQERSSTDTSERVRGRQREGRSSKKSLIRTNANRLVMERRVIENQPARRTVVQNEYLNRMSRNLYSRQLISEKRSEKVIDVRYQRALPLENIDKINDMKTIISKPEIFLENAKNTNTTNEVYSEEIFKWIGSKTYENLKIGDWTTNCLIGAVAYFVTVRQVKSV